MEMSACKYCCTARQCYFQNSEKCFTSCEKHVKSCESENVEFLVAGFIYFLLDAIIFFNTCANK